MTSKWGINNDYVELMTKLPGFVCVCVCVFFPTSPTDALTADAWSQAGQW